jgi:inosose dehydratase
MSTIPIGNAPCSWGTLEFGGEKHERVTYTRMLDELVQTGYSGSELGDWGFMPTDPVRLADEFIRRGIDLTGAYVGVNLRDRAAHDPGEAEVLKVARLISAAADGIGGVTRPFLVLAADSGSDPVRTKNAGRVTPEMELSADEWRAVAEGVERIARLVREETGLRTVFHHHCAGHIEAPREIDRLMDMTDPALVGLVFDTGHYSYGAGGCDDVIDALERYGSRIWYVHFKDCHPEVIAQARRNEWDYFEAVRNGIFCELGKGCVDFPSVRDWLIEHNYSEYITVEQDVLPGMGTPKESAERNREYLRSIEL